MGSIYRLYCKESEKNYIGQHNNEDPTKRIRDHFMEAECERSDAVIYKAIRKYGRDAFEAFVVCVCKTQEELDYMEDHYITEYKSMMDENGYNMKRGGMKRCVGYKHTEETKKVLSKMRTGVPISEEQKKKLSSSLKGKPKVWSQEALETMSERNKSNASGHIYTEEEKKKRSDALKGVSKDFSQLESEEINKDIEKIKDFINEVIENIEYDKDVYTASSYRKMQIKDIVFLRLFPKRHTLRKYGELYGCGNSSIACIINSKSYKDIVIPKKYYDEARKYDNLFDKPKQIKEEVKYTEVPKEKLEEWSQPVFEQKTIKIPKKKTESKTGPQADKKEPEGLDSVNIPEDDCGYNINNDIAQVQDIIDEIKSLIPDVKQNQQHSRKLSYDQVIFIRLFPNKFSTRAYGKIMGCSDAIIRDIIKFKGYKNVEIPEKYIGIASTFVFKK
jgi:group I intron endonuclease